MSLEVAVGIHEKEVQQPLSLAWRYVVSQQQLLLMLDKEQDEDRLTLVTLADV